MMKSALAKRAGQKSVAQEEAQRVSKSVTFDKTDEIIRYEMASPYMGESDVSEEDRPLPSLPSYPVSGNGGDQSEVDRRREVLESRYKAELQKPVEDQDFDFDFDLNSSFTRKEHLSKQEEELQQLQAQIKDLQDHLNLPNESTSSLSSNEHKETNPATEKGAGSKENANDVQSPILDTSKAPIGQESRHKRSESNNSIQSENEMYTPFKKPVVKEIEEEEPIVMRDNSLLARQDSLQDSQRTLPTQGNSLPFPAVERSYSKRRQQILSLLDPHGPGNQRTLEFDTIMEEEEPASEATRISHSSVLQQDSMVSQLDNSDLKYPDMLKAVSYSDENASFDDIKPLQANDSVSANDSVTNSEIYNDKEKVNHSQNFETETDSTNQPELSTNGIEEDDEEGLEKCPSESIIPQLGEYSVGENLDDDILRKLDVPQPYFASNTSNEFDIPTNSEMPTDMHLDSDLDDTNQIDPVVQLGSSLSPSSQPSEGEIEVSEESNEESNDESNDESNAESIEESNEEVNEGEESHDESEETSFELDPNSHFDSHSSIHSEDNRIPVQIDSMSTFDQYRDISMRSLLILRDASILSALSGRDPSMMSMRIDFGDDRSWLGGFLRNPDAGLRDLDGSRFIEVNDSEESQDEAEAEDNEDNEAEDNEESNESNESDEEFNPNATCATLDTVQSGVSLSKVGNETIGISNEPAALYAAGLSPEIGNLSMATEDTNFTRESESKKYDNVLDLLQPDEEFSEEEHSDALSSASSSFMTHRQQSYDIEKTPQIERNSSVDIDSMLSRDTADIFIPLKSPEREKKSPLLEKSDASDSFNKTSSKELPSDYEVMKAEKFNYVGPQLTNWVTSDSDSSSAERDMTRSESRKSLLQIGNEEGKVSPEILQFIYKNSPELAGERETSTLTPSQSDLFAPDQSVTFRAEKDESLLNEPSLGENMANTVQSLLSDSFGSSTNSRNGYILRDNGSLVIATGNTRKLPHRPTGYEIVPDGDTFVYKQAQHAIPRRPLPSNADPQAQTSNAPNHTVSDEDLTLNTTTASSSTMTAPFASLPANSTAASARIPANSVSDDSIPSNITATSIAHSVNGQDTNSRPQFPRQSSVVLKSIPEASIPSVQSVASIPSNINVMEARKPNLEVIEDSNEYISLPQSRRAPFASSTASNTASNTASTDTYKEPSTNTHSEQSEPSTGPSIASVAPAVPPHPVPAQQAPPVPPHPATNRQPHSTALTGPVIASVPPPVPPHPSASYKHATSALNPPSSAVNNAETGFEHVESEHPVPAMTAPKPPVEKDVSNNHIAQTFIPDVSASQDPVPQTFSPILPDEEEAVKNDQTEGEKDVWEHSKDTNTAENTASGVNTDSMPLEHVEKGVYNEQVDNPPQTTTAPSDPRIESSENRESSSVYDTSTDVVSDHGVDVKKGPLTSKTASQVNSRPPNFYKTVPLSKLFTKSEVSHNIDDRKHGLLYVSVDHIKLSKVPMGTLVKVVLDNGTQRIESESMSLAKLDKYAQEYRISIETSQPVQLTIKLARQKASSWVKRLSYSKLVVGSDGSYSQCDLTGLCTSKGALNTATLKGMNYWTKSKPSCSAEIRIRSLYIPCVFKDEVLPKNMQLASQMIEKMQLEVKNAKYRAQGPMKQFGGDTPNGKIRYFILDPVKPVLVACSITTRKTRTLINLSKATAVQKLQPSKFQINFKNGDNLDFSVEKKQDFETWVRELSRVIESKVENRPRWLNCVMYEC